MSRRRGQGWGKEERSGMGQGGEVRGRARRRGQGCGKEVCQGGEVRGGARRG